MTYLTQREKQEIYDNTAIATTTFYKPNSEIGLNRQILAEKMIKNATNLGYAIIVVDGGSSEEFLRKIERYGAKVFEETERGMSPSRRQSIRGAYDTGRLVQSWIEPEKEGYIKELEKTVIPILGGEADLVVPDARIKTPQGYSLPHYPTSQRNEELYGNDCWRELTSMDLDIWRGPKTWRKEESSYFLDYDGREMSYGDKWESIVIPVMKMALDGKRVIGVEVDYMHPKEQTKFEEGNFKITLKRLDQLTNLVPAFTDYWEKYYPTSKLRKMRETV